MFILRELENVPEISKNYVRQTNPDDYLCTGLFPLVSFSLTVTLTVAVTCLLNLG